MRKRNRVKVKVSIQKRKLQVKDSISSANRLILVSFTCVDSTNEGFPFVASI